MTRSRTLTQIDTGLAHVEETKARVEHWLRLHFSWAWRTHAYEETFTFSFSITGKLRERARRLAIARIRADLRAMGVNSRFIGDGADDAQWAENNSSPEWLADLPETGSVRTPAIDHEAAARRHQRPSVR